MFCYQIQFELVADLKFLSQKLKALLNKNYDAGYNSFFSIPTNLGTKHILKKLQYYLFIVHRQRPCFYYVNNRNRKKYLKQKDGGNNWREIKSNSLMWVDLARVQEHGTTHTLTHKLSADDVSGSPGAKKALGENNIRFYVKD